MLQVQLFGIYGWFCLFFFLLSVNQFRDRTGSLPYMCSLQELAWITSGQDKGAASSFCWVSFKVVHKYTAVGLLSQGFHCVIINHDHVPLVVVMWDGLIGFYFLPLPSPSLYCNLLIFKLISHFSLFCNRSKSSLYCCGAYGVQKGASDYYIQSNLLDFRWLFESTKCSFHPIGGIQQGGG